MLQDRSKVLFFYAVNTFSSILRLRQRNIYRKNHGKREHLNPASIPKFKNQLNKPCIYHPMLIKSGHGNKNTTEKTKSEQLYYIDICKFNQQVLPDGFPQTPVIGCGGLASEPNKRRIRYVRTSPGGTFEGKKFIPIHVKWRNKLNIPVSMHIHGGEAPPKYDSLYEGNQGGDKEEFQIYINNQEAAAYWYHGQNDKSKVDYNNSGLLGFYMLREAKNDNRNNYGHMDLPTSKYEYPIIIQDCSFYTDGSYISPLQKTNTSDTKTTLVSEGRYFGDTIMVNGKVWPNLDVERRQYRFYILNGSNSRFFNLKLSNDMNFTVIGGDGGLLPSPVNSNAILLGPGERTDVLIDFSRLPTGSKIILKNDANAPYPFGDSPDIETTGQILRFNIPECEAISISPMKLPDKLCDQPSMPLNLRQRVRIISDDIESTENPIILDRQIYDSTITIEPKIKSTEEWCFVNLTSKAYPIYIEQAKFKIINRQDIDIVSIRDNFKNIDENQSIDSYLVGEPLEPEDFETGWKDTLRADPGILTRIVMMPYNK
jgi:FtsP/CotA-like multicopper oxidase with cupredoxin domain